MMESTITGRNAVGGRSAAVVVLLGRIPATWEGKNEYKKFTTNHHEQYTEIELQFVVVRVVRGKNFI